MGSLLPFSAPAQASWQEDLGSLRIGIVTSGRNSTILPSVEPFRLAMQEKLSVPVEIFGAPDLPALIRAHAEGKVEYAVFSALSYAATWNLCECVEPAALVRSGDGSDSVVSIVLVRKGSAIGKPVDLIGKKILVLGQQSIAGFAFPLFEMQQQGITLNRENTGFIFAESAEEAIARFASGEGDALIGWAPSSGNAGAVETSGTLHKLLQLSGGLPVDFTRIWQSPPIPQKVHSIRKNLPGEAKREIRALLSDLFDSDPIAYDSIEPVLGGGFEIATQSRFLQLIEFAANPLVKPLIPEKTVEPAAEPKSQ
jgi:phosphonate transport system substrate-binding protein